MHVVTLSFDDGFERSSIRTTEIFERYGLTAELHVLAAGHLGEPNESWHRRWRKGDFGLWSELAARGHHLMPHGYRHANKAELPLEEAERLIEACLEVFRAELDGFDASKASFAFPYNRSSPQLEAWLATRVRAFRTGGDPVMPLPRPGQQKVTCASFGPGRCDDHLAEAIESFLAGPRAGSVTTFTGSTTKAGGRSAAVRSPVCSNASSRTMCACSRSRPRSTWPWRDSAGSAMRDCDSQAERDQHGSGGRLECSLDPWPDDRSVHARNERRVGRQPDEADQDVDRREEAHLERHRSVPVDELRQVADEEERRPAPASLTTV